MGVGLRIAGLLIGLLGLVLGLGLGLGLAGPARANQADRLMDVLRITEAIEVMRDEGLTFGGDLDLDMLGGQGGDFWAAEVDRIYDPDRMQRAVHRALAQGLDDDEMARSLAFFDTPLGQRILILETTARRAMTDKEIETLARDTYREMMHDDDPRLAEITRFIEVNDLLERNVAGALSSVYHFMLGMAEGGSDNNDEAAIVADVWSQEEETRDDARDWLFGFLLMAYRPLSDEDLEAYNVFSETAAGQALNAALFDGFDNMYLEISHDLGVAMARALKTSDL